MLNGKRPLEASRAESTIWNTRPHEDFRCQCLRNQALHLVDLGVASHAYGNLLFEIMEDSLVGNRTVSLQELNRVVANAYDLLGIPAKRRIVNFKLSNFKAGTSDYPQFSHIKGRKVRWFSQVAVQLAQSFKNADRKTHHRLACVKALDSLYSCLDSPCLIYDEALQASFQKSVEAFLAHYGHLATASMNSNLCRYSIVQKHHLLAHLPAQSKFIASRCAWTYGGESFMGFMVRLSAMCVQGTPPWKLPSKLFQKNRLAMHLIWAHGLDYEDDNVEEHEVHE